MKQREKPACRQGHPCFLFVHDIACAVIPTFRSFVTFTTNCMFLNSLIYVLYFVTFTYGHLQQRENSGRRQGHLCLRFVNDFVSVVFDTRNSCGWRHFSTKRTAIRPLRGQNVLRGTQPLKIVLICTVVDYIWKVYSLQYRSVQLVRPDSPFMMYPFYSSNTQRESKQGVPTVETQRFSLVPCCVLHRLETRTCTHNQKKRSCWWDCCLI